LVPRGKPRSEKKMQKQDAATPGKLSKQGVRKFWGRYWEGDITERKEGGKRKGKEGEKRGKKKRGGKRGKGGGKKKKRERREKRGERKKGKRKREKKGEEERKQTEGDPNVSFKRKEKPRGRTDPLKQRGGEEIKGKISRNLSEESKSKLREEDRGGGGESFLASFELGK